MTLSSVLFSGMAMLVRLTRDVGVNIYLVTLFRFGVGAVLIFLFGASRWVRLRAVNRRWLFMRGFFGGLAVIAYFYSIRYCGLGKGTVLSNTFPIFAAIFAPMVLRDRSRPDVWLAILAAFFGVYLLVGVQGIGRIQGSDLVAVGGGMCGGIAVVAIKKLRETDSAYVIFLSQCCFGLLFVSGLSLGGPFPSAAGIWWLLIAIGLVAASAQLIMTYAYKLIPVTEGSLISFLSPAINVIAGVAVFHETMTAAMAVGCVLVLASCAYTMLRERLARLVR